MSDQEHFPELVGQNLNRKKLDLTPGSFVQREGVVYRLIEVLDFNTVVGVDVSSGRSQALRIGELKPVADAKDALSDLAAVDLEEIADEEWRVAETRYAAIKPLLQNGGRAAVEERSGEVGVDPATLYRWLRRYQSLGVVSALIPRKRGWKQGASRISQQTEDIITEVLRDKYLTEQRSSPQKAILEVLRLCGIRGVQPPHPMTVRNRINSLSERHSLRARGYKEKAKNKFMPAAGSFPNADYPLAVVQIDHTPVDITLVDDVHRESIGRPWITLAIDVYSRMVTGYYLSFEAPSETSVAMCVAHSILPKDEWLALHGVNAHWDVWGLMTTIHTDNGAEFRSDNFRQACLLHSINLEFRPVKQPRYGGHIERLLGTLAREIHDLPGTTFSSIKAREGYDSDKHSAMTKSEFETWLVTLICKVYHQRMHKGIGMSPSRKWEIGLFGNAETVGRGLPPRPADRLSLLLDFLPSFHRSIQTYGVDIESLRYYSDVLRAWINSADSKEPDKKRQFIFRRDPRDISVIWFRDPELAQYFRIPFANQALPSMSVWEYEQVKARAKAEGTKSVDDSQILRGLTEMRDQVHEAKEKTKKARRQSQRRREHEKGVSPVAPLANMPAARAASKAELVVDGFVDGEVDAFDDIS